MYMLYSFERALREETNRSKPQRYREAKKDSKRVDAVGAWHVQAGQHLPEAISQWLYFESGMETGQVSIPYFFCFFLNSSAPLIEVFKQEVEK
jgi:hypothetical protein